VDVATGTLYSTHKDISIPGKVALTWERRYSTSLLGSPPTPLGPGWTSRYFATLTREKDQYRLVSPEGETEIFADPEGTIEKGGVVRNLGTFQELAKRGDDYVVTRWDVDTGNIERFAFRAGKAGEAWLLASVEDVTGQGLDMLRYPTGRLTGVRQKLEKRTLLLEYAPTNRIRSIEFPMPDGKREVLARFEYDQDGRLIAAFDALGFADRYEYDSAGRMVREILKDGGVFTFRYDDKGRCVHTVGLDGYDEKTFRYLDHIHWTEVTNSLGHTTRYQWLATGQVVAEVNPLGAVRRSDYDDRGRLAAVHDPNGATTSYQYDAQGNRSKRTDPLGHEWSWTYNDTHQPQTLRDPVGARWLQAFDSAHRVSATEDPLGGRWTYEHDAHGNLVQVTNPNGVYTRLVFSDRGILQEIRDWEGNCTRYVLDQLGRIITSTTNAGLITQRTYDLVGNLLRLTIPSGAWLAFGYDPGRNRISITDWRGQTSKYRYGPCRRLYEKISTQGAIGRYFWASEPRCLERIIDWSGATHLFEYDAAGRLVRETGFDGRTLEYSRDRSGACIAFMNGLGQRITHKRDPNGRLIERRLPDNTSLTFEYDAVGQLIAAKSPDCELHFTRDLLGRVTKETQGDHILEYSYDLAGNLLKIRTDLGYDVCRVFDSKDVAARLVVNGQYGFTFETTPDGRTRRELPGGLCLEHEFDRKARSMTQQLHSAKRQPSVSSNDESRRLGSGALFHRVYSFDLGGNVVSVDDRKWGKATYSYDSSDCTVSVNDDGGWSETFEYDVSRNLTRRQRAGTDPESFEYSEGNRITRRNSIQYFHDAQGRLVRKVELGASGQREWTYEWDAMDQLRAVVTPENTKWEYHYDPLGRRVCKDGPYGKEWFLWDRDFIIQQFDSKTVRCSWVYVPNTFAPLGRIEQGEVASVVTDHLGAPCELIDMDGRQLWSVRYWLWGEVRQIVGSEAACRLRFPGQWHDEESGFHYNRFRYYDPCTGRFICADPAKLLSGWNVYTYAPNPVNWIDPYGLASLYRGMHRDSDGRPVVYSGEPQGGQNAANSLGVRPREEGMSTSLDPSGIQEHRRPPEFGGRQGQNPSTAPHGAGMYAIDSDVLAQHGLTHVNDHDTHVAIQTAPGVPPDELPARLAATRDHWEEVTPEDVQRRQQQGEGCGA
jgi:RHS repeat-associated protein